MRLKHEDATVQVETIMRSKTTGRLASAVIGAYDGDGNPLAFTRWELHEYDGRPNWLMWYQVGAAACIDNVDEPDGRPCLRNSDMRLVLDLLDKLAEGEARGEPS